MDLKIDPTPVILGPLLRFKNGPKNKHSLSVKRVKITTLGVVNLTTLNVVKKTCYPC